MVISLFYFLEQKAGSEPQMSRMLFSKFLVKVTNSRDLNFGQAMSFHGELKWCGIHSNWQERWCWISPAVSRQYGRYIKYVCVCRTLILALTLKLRLKLHMFLH